MWMNTRGPVAPGPGGGTRDRAGRIAIPAAKEGARILGVDSSEAMLERCRVRMNKAGVGERITLQRADFLDFSVPEPAALITVPFHTIGHLVSMDDKRRALARIHTSLRPGGRFVFDHFVPNLDYARSRSGVPQLRAEYVDERTGRDCLLWVVMTVDFDLQSMRFVCWTDELDEGDRIAARRYRRMTFSYLFPEQSRALLEEAGFTIDSVYGDFDRSPLTAESREQIWIARR